MQQATHDKRFCVVSGAVDLSGKLHELSQLQIKQQDNAGGVTDEVQNLLSSYNAVVSFSGAWEPILKQVHLMTLYKDTICIDHEWKSFFTDLLIHLNFPSELLPVLAGLTTLFGIFIKLEFFHAQCSFRQDLFSGMWLSHLVILRILMHKQQSP